MGFFSLFLFGFSAWTYSQSIYTEKIKNSFYQNEITKISNLKDTSLLSNNIAIISGEIVSDENFLSKDGQKVVLERYKEENKTARGWQEIKDTNYFKVIPFKIRDKSQKEVFIDPYGLDKAYVGEPKTKNENESLKKSFWKIKKGQKVLILGRVENKNGNFVISDPNLRKSIFESLFDKEPFIITTMDKTQIAIRAEEIGKSIFISSIALLIVGIFFIFYSFANILKNYRQSQKDF